MQFDIFMKTFLSWFWFVIKWHYWFARSLIFLLLLEFFTVFFFVVVVYLYHNENYLTLGPRNHFAFRKYFIFCLCVQFPDSKLFAFYVLIEAKKWAKQKSRNWSSKGEWRELVKDRKRREKQAIRWNWIGYSNCTRIQAAKRRKKTKYLMDNFDWASVCFGWLCDVPHFCFSSHFLSTCLM